MSNWNKIIVSGSRAQVSSTAISGIPANITHFHLSSIGPGWDGSPTHETAWYNHASSTPVGSDGYQLQWAWTADSGDGTTSGTTGPVNGPVDWEIDENLTKAQTAGNSAFLYTETSSPRDDADDVFYLRSPKVTLPSSGQTTLVFYVHAVGSDIGTLDVWFGPDHDFITNATDITSYTRYVDINFNWYEGPWTAGTNLQSGQSSPFHRVEVDISAVTETLYSEGYIWFKYNGASGYAGDFAMANIYMTTDYGTPGVALQVDSGVISFPNLTVGSSGTNWGVTSDSNGLLRINTP
jgi:hypothetical protein